MKKLLAISFFILCLFGMTSTVSAEEVGGAIDLSSSVYISAINYDDDNEYVVLTNTGDDIVVEQMTLEFFKESDGTVPNLVVGFSNGVLLSDKSIVIGKDVGSSDKLDVEYSGGQILQSKGRFHLTINGLSVTDVCWGGGSSCSDAMSSGEMLVSPCLTGSGIDCFDLYPYVGGLSLISGGWQPNIETNSGITMLYSGDNPVDPMTFVENTDCQRLQINEIGANLSDKFIEFANTSLEDIDLNGCIVKTNSNSKVFVFGDETLAADALRLVRIGDTELTLSKTVSGTVYIMSNDGKTELQSVTYPAMKSGTSYWLLDGAWKVASKPSPGQINYLPPTNYCRNIRISEIAANADEQFIEVVNNGGSDVNLKGCRIMTNRSASNYFAFGDETLSPNAFRIVKISDTNLTLTKTTNGIVYLTSSDGETEIDAVNYSDLDEGTSWALVDDTWGQTYKVTAGSANIYQEYPACNVGYYRNTETGRCNKIAVMQSTALTPCKAGYERNPLTNRCRKIVTTTSTDLKACAEGYERNPDTNRCRKIVSTAAASYALEATTPTGNSNSLMLASAGIFGVTLLVVAMQYRMEIANGAKKLSSLLGSFIKSS